MNSKALMAIMLVVGLAAGAGAMFVVEELMEDEEDEGSGTDVIFGSDVLYRQTVEPDDFVENITNPFFPLKDREPGPWSPLNG